MGIYSITVDSDLGPACFSLLSKKWENPNKIETLDIEWWSYPEPFNIAELIKELEAKTGM